MADLESALLDAIGARCGRAELAFRERPVALRGGYFAEIFRFSLADPPRGFRGELILRRMPDAARARREIAVHTAAVELGFPTPRIRASGGSGEPLGAAFAIMDLAPGTTLDGAPGLAARLRRIAGMPRLLAEASSRLHALPASSVAARVSQRGVEPAELSLDALLAELARAVRALDSAELAGALEALLRRRLPERELALCHGDLHANNLVVAADGSWRAIDWTNARLGEPELDLGFASELLELAPRRVPRGARSLLAFACRRASRAFLARYSGPTPLDPARLGWYRALYRLQLLVRVAAARAALPGVAPLGPSHPYWLVERNARARLRAALPG